MVQATEDLDLALQRLQRLHGAVEFEILSFAFGPPGGLDGAIREINEGHPERRAGGGGGQLAGSFGFTGEELKRRERVEGGHREAGAKAAEEMAAVQAGVALRGEVLARRENRFHGGN